MNPKAAPDTKPATAASPSRLLPLVPAAASALFALQSHADAAIIYSGPESLTIGPVGAVGIAQGTVQITAGFEIPFSVQRRNQGGNHYAVVGVLGSGVAFHDNSNTGGFGMHRYARGAAISVGGSISLNVGAMAYFKNGLQRGGTWLKGQTGFGGFEMPNGDIGWIRLEWTSTDSDPSPNELIAMDWAYDTTPGETIDAGQTSSSVPEPSATALLALAGAGASFLRRRRAEF